ncbi:YugN family protein [Kurthia sibirica]|uniref:YugN-like family protein n=1 Tax=Kurthia sibirica TaxID=202750 RepID=A0A2U3AQH2_9BACL|nr:YugN family protein [Kurthia sibirica]PWI26798.1 hypothetical protein DEX24_00425 [Kurthia sibirica]GEK32667.1 hypothetical protein KSI01_02000 [Kurthia sibirica]
MYFENTGIEDKLADIVVLDDLMRKQGLIRSTGWDYERVTWDRKFIVPEGTYYLRIFGIAEDGGDIGSNDAVIRLLKPVLGKHYFPHGVEYGDDEVWAVSVVDHAKKLLEALNEELQTFAIITE